MEKWHAAKPGSIVDRMPAPKKDHKPVPVKSPTPPTRSRPRSSRSRRRRPPQYTAVFADALVAEERRATRA